MTALDRKLLRDLKLLWSQALTLALVVAAAVAGFMTTYSAYDSLQYSRDRFYTDGQFADVFADLKRAPNRIMQQLADVPGVASLETTVVRDVQVSIPGVRDPIIGKLIGLDPKHPPQINRVFLRSGRMMSEQSSGPREVLVSEAFALARGLQPGDHLFALINGKRERLLITGIALSPEFIFAGFSGAPDLKGFGVFWLDKQSLASADQMDGAFNHVNLRLAPGARQDETIASIDRVLQAWGGVRAYGRDEQLSYTRVESEIKEQRVLGTLLPAIFLAIAAFLLNVVLGRQILMQREQIAALKALGYDNARIGWHYIKLALLIVTVGVVIGLVCGAWLGEMLTTLYRKSFSFPEFYFRVRPELVLIALFTTLSAALAATWQAIKSSVRLAPAEAMRPRSPGVYHPTLIEKLGWRSAFSPSMRMVFRNMQRNSIRASVTVLGVAASISVLISGTFWGDAIDLLLSTQFRQVLRADISIGLIEPRNINALHALARLPYVSAIEPARLVPVRLLHQHRHWRGLIQGRPSIPQLHRVVGLDKRAMPLPSDGLLLTDRLAHKLGVRVGEMLIVEVEEGQRATLTLPVVAVVSELMGMSAYIERRSLNNLLREGDVLNRATLLVDRGYESDLLQRLQQVPAVAAAFSKASMLANVQGITARNLRIITGVLTIFASIIAVGVVYNQVRVALAERA